MVTITPEQRAAALRAMEIEEDKYVIFVNAGLRQTHLDALIAAGWGPVADAEARGYRAGVEDAARTAVRTEPRGCDFVAVWSQYEHGVADTQRATATAIRALADKPREPL